MARVVVTNESDVGGEGRLVDKVEAADAAVPREGSPHLEWGQVLWQFFDVQII